MNKSVLIISQDIEFREQIRFKLKNRSGFEILDNNTRSSKPDLIFVKYQYNFHPQVSQLAKKYKGSKIMAFTSNLSGEKAVNALKNNVSGYVSENIGSVALAQCMQDVCSGGIVVSPGILANIFKTGRSTDNTDIMHSDREIEVIELISKGLTYEQTAEELFISVNTVRYHMKRIFSKHSVHNRTGLLRQLPST